MLKKNVDLIIVGNNYISYLLAYQLILVHRDVLILNDERVSVDENHFKTFSLLESSFIGTWGEDLESSHLKDIANYLTPAPYFVKLGNREVLLGRGNPFANLKELARKFPEYFYNLYEVLATAEISEEDFNASFLQMCSRVGKTLCRYKTLSNFSTSTFLNHCSDYFVEIFDLFYDNIKIDKDGDDSKALFTYAMRAIFHDVLSIKLSKIEAIHLLISLLSPRYNLKTSDILTPLQELLEERGGNYRDTQIREWKFDKSRPWCVELNSFEGIVHPKRLAFIGGRPRNIPLQLSFDNIYKCYHLRVSRKRLYTNKIKSYHFNQLAMGTQFPFWVISDESDFTLIKVFSKTLECEKEDFLIKEITDLLINYKVISSADKIIDIKLSDEVIAGGVAKSANLPEKMVLTDGAFALGAQKLKDVHYIGPCKRGALGLLSSLMESKDFRSFL